MVNHTQNPHGRSLRRRIRLWTCLVTGLTFTVLTAVAVVEERQHVLSFQRGAAEAMLLHLAQMPEVGRSYPAASGALEAMAPPLAQSGVHLSVAFAESVDVGEVLARRPLLVGDRWYELRYSVAPGWARQVTLRALVSHTVLGVAMMVLTILGIEHILARKLLRPLAAMAHQVRHMRRGGGWEPRLPETDDELTDLAAALRELAPALDAQVHEWIDAERRAAVMLALGDVRQKLSERLRRVLTVLGDLQARSQVLPEGVRGLRAAIRELEQLREDVSLAASASVAVVDSQPALLQRP